MGSSLDLRSLGPACASCRTRSRVCTAPEMGLLEFLNGPKGKFLNGKMQETLAPNGEQSNIQPSRSILDVFGKPPSYDTRQVKVPKKKVMPVQFPKKAMPSNLKKRK